MRLGVSTYTYTWAIGVAGSEPQFPMTGVNLLQKAKTLGIDCVQIADNLPLHTFSEDDLNNLTLKAQESGILVEVGMRGLFPDLVMKYLDIALTFNSPFLRIVVDGPNFHPSSSEVVTIIRSLLPELKKRNIILAIENHDRFKAKTFASIIEQVGSKHVGICLDSVNSMGAGEGIETVIELLAPYTVNLHIKDFYVQRVYHMMGFVVEGKPAGKGMLNIENLLEKLEMYNNCQSGTLELWTPPQEKIEDTIWKENAWAEESISYLKKLFSKKQNNQI
jgi:sugar phosphate isomerase/epimerase